MNQVPVVDLSDPAVIARDPEMLAELDQACRDHGFFLLTGHGLDEVFARMWSQAADFFASPRSERLQILRTEDRPLGYYDRELTKQKRDLKEVFDFMRPAADHKGRNQWPEQRPEFTAAMNDFYESMSDLAAETLNLVLSALGVDGQGLVGDANTSNVRLNNYPLGDPLSREEQKSVNALGDMALHHHTDPGLITLLLQDQTGGLQTHSLEHGWIDVPPLAGSVIVNLGDVLQAFSNDVYRAAMHRVVPMREQARMSTPYFYNPPAEATISPHPGLCRPDAKYRPISWREYIGARIADNYTDLGADDTQIDHYRVA